MAHGAARPHAAVTAERAPAGSLNLPQSILGDCVHLLNVAAVAFIAAAVLNSTFQAGLSGPVSTLAVAASEVSPEARAERRNSVRLFSFWNQRRYKLDLLATAGRSPNQMPT